MGIFGQNLEKREEWSEGQIVLHSNMGTISRVWLKLLLLRGKQREGKKHPRNNGGGGRGGGSLRSKLTEMAKSLSNLENSEVFKVFALPPYKDFLGFPKPFLVPTKVLFYLFVCLYYFFHEVG